METAFDLGTYRDVTYHLTGRRGEDWSVQIHVDVRAAGPVEIVRIDTSHGPPEIHRRYRRDQPVEPIDVAGFWDAVAHLSERWRRFARRHHANDHLPVPDKERAP